MKKKRNILLALLLLCSTAIADDASIVIVRGYEGMSHYADAATYAEPEAYGALFDRHVFQRYQRQCAGLGPERETSRRWLSSPVQDIDALKSALDQIKKSNADERTLEAARRAATLLPGVPVTICIFVYPPDSGSAGFVADVMGGAMGFSDAAGSLWLQVLPTEGWLDEIYPAVTHEYYHAVAFPGAPGTVTLLDVLINEGGADSLTAILYPDFVPEWTRALTPEQQADVWEQMRNVLDTTDQKLIDHFIFGDGDEVPRQAGYTIGFEILQAWLERHPDVPPSEWSKLTPTTILEGSGYEP